MAWQLSFCFFCDVDFWCQVLRTLLKYFQRYSWLSVVLFEWNDLWRYHFPHLHNTKTWISLKRKKIFWKRKRHSSWLWKPFQKSSNYFLLHRHFKRCFCLCSPKICKNVTTVLQATFSQAFTVNWFWWRIKTKYPTSTHSFDLDHNQKTID